MQLGMIGLGRMGANIVRRLMKNGHECVVFNRSPEKVKQLADEGAMGTYNLDDFVSKLSKPRAIWLMIPAGEPTANMVKELAQKLEPGDMLIDGGNSYYIDDIQRATELAPKGIHYLDVGTSGGVWGLDRGYCMMIGGPDVAVQHLDPIFKTIAPGRGEIPRTPGREKVVSDSGEGRWTIAAAIDEGISVPVFSAALFQRFSSRGQDEFADKLLSAMRFQFGGHLEQTP